MSVTKHARISLFGTSGNNMDWVVFWLETYAKSVVPEYAEKGLEYIATLAKMTAEVEYGDADIIMDAEVNHNTVTIIASGPEVAFWEFGTGTYADPGANELAAGTPAVGFDVYPGSWSTGPEGKFKYYQVRYGGVSMDDWEYTKVPRPGLLAAYNAIKQQYALLMQGAFKE